MPTEILILALWCTGLRIASSEGMILNSIDKWAKENLSTWIYKPTIGCIYCMASVHGFMIHSFFVIFLDFPIWQYPIIMVCGIAGNGMVMLIYDILSGLGDALEELNGHR